MQSLIEAVKEKSQRSYSAGGIFDYLLLDDVIALIKQHEQQGVDESELWEKITQSIFGVRYKDKKLNDDAKWIALNECTEEANEVMSVIRPYIHPQQQPVSADVAGATLDASALLALAKKRYAAETNNHPKIHCNRFPSWAELSDVNKFPYIFQAIAAMQGETPASCVKSDCDKGGSIKQNADCLIQTPDQARVKELEAALEESTRIMAGMEILLAPHHDKMHDNNQPHEAFHDSIFQRLRNRRLLGQPIGAGSGEAV